MPSVLCTSPLLKPKNNRQNFYAHFLLFSFENFFFGWLVDSCFLKGFSNTLLCSSQLSKTGPPWPFFGVWLFPQLHSKSISLHLKYCTPLCIWKLLSIYSEVRGGEFYHGTSDVRSKLLEVTHLVITLFSEERLLPMHTWSKDSTYH